MIETRAEKTGAFLTSDTPEADGFIREPIIPSADVEVIGHCTEYGT